MIPPEASIGEILNGSPHLTRLFGPAQDRGVAAGVRAAVERFPLAYPRDLRFLSTIAPRMSRNATRRTT